MIVLDTDHLSVLQHQDSRHAKALRERIQSSEDGDVVTTIVTYEEQVRSWLNQIGRCSDVHEQIPFYKRLSQFAMFYANWELLPFTELAAEAFKQFRKQRIRISTTDLKIASIVVTYEATFLTANIQDFQQVPGLIVENWLSGD